MLYLPEVVDLELDSARCNGCGLCLKVCPHAVFAKNDATRCQGRAVSELHLTADPISRRVLGSTTHERLSDPHDGQPLEMMPSLTADW